MTNQVRVAKLFKPLLARHDDLFLFGRYLLLRPIHHFISGVYIDSGGDLSRFWPECVNVHLCCGVGIGKYALADRIISRTPTLWEWSNRPMLDELIDIIETETLPALRSIRSFDDYLASSSIGLTPPGALKHFYVQALALHIANGDLDRAIEIVTAHDLETFDPSRPIGWFKYSKSDRDWINDNLRLLPPLMRRDRQGLATILHAFEAKSIKVAKLEPYWQPTPFPLEALA